MAESPTGRMKRRGVEAERGRLIRPPQRLLDKLQPFAFSDAKVGLRRADVAAFSAVAALTDTIILLRATNPDSVPYIGVKGYTAKPIDCKAKTAKSNDLVAGHVVECAGLVVDPGLLSQKVFDSGDERVAKCWQEFVRDHPRIKVKSGAEVFSRKTVKGFYAVDTARPSTALRHYGCMMLSSQDVPNDFDPAHSHTRGWMRQNMAYVHGDYDLYGIIDAPAIDRQRGVKVLHVMEEPLLGTTNKFTERTREVQDCLNAAIGCEMVHHGEQVAENFIADRIYVFDFNGGKWVIEKGVSEREMVGMLTDLFRYVFGTEIA